MLRALDPEESPRRAYPVPWRVDRIYDTHVFVTNAGHAVVDFVRVFVDSPRVASETAAWGQMLAGETAELCLCEIDPDDTIVTLAWFHPETGVEYIWRCVV